MTRIILQSAREFDLLKPRSDLITTLDIAHALSLICRFNGHCTRHYSVAQHSLLVADIVQSQGHGPEIQLQALLHDATEAYISDLVRPLKLLLIEAARQREIAWLNLVGQVSAQRHAAYLAAAAMRILTTAEQEGVSLLLDTYHQIEERIWLAIAERFQLATELPECVKHADMIALATERRDLLPDHPTAWECLKGITPHRIELDNWAPGQSRQAFHDRLLDLLATTHRARAAA